MTATIDRGEHNLMVCAKLIGKYRRYIEKSRPDLIDLLDEVQKLGESARPLSPLIPLERIVDFTVYDVYGFQNTLGIPFLNRISRISAPSSYFFGAFQHGRLKAYLRDYMPDKLKIYEEHYETSRNSGE